MTGWCARHRVLYRKQPVATQRTTTTDRQLKGCAACIRCDLDLLNTLSPSSWGRLFRVGDKHSGRTVYQAAWLQAITSEFPAIVLFHRAKATAVPFRPFVSLQVELGRRLLAGWFVLQEARAMCSAVGRQTKLGSFVLLSNPNPVCKHGPINHSLFLVCVTLNYSLEVVFALHP